MPNSEYAPISDLHLIVCDYGVKLGTHGLLSCIACNVCSKVVHVILQACPQNSYASCCDRDWFIPCLHDTKITDPCHI